MQTNVEQIVVKYEQGVLNRQQFIQAIEDLLAKARTDAAPGSGEPPQTAVTIDHVTFLVKDLDVTARFYEQVFGIRAERKEGPVYYLRVGNSFIGLIAAGNRPPGFNHYCLGLKDYDAGQVAEKLKGLGLNADPAVTPRIIDPDGAHVQFGATTYARTTLAARKS